MSVFLHVLVLAQLGVVLVEATYSYHFHGTKVDFSTAVSNCLAQGQALVMPKSQLEFDTLMATLNNDPSWQSYASTNFQSFWFGLRDADHDREFSWIDGSPLEWTYWHDGRPDNFHGNQHCAFIYQRDRYYNKNVIKWGDVRCGAMLPYVCQIATSSCYVSLTGNSGEFSSPGYDQGDEYTNNLQCDYFVTVAEGQAVQITFQSPFNVEPSNGGCYDAVKIYDAGYRNTLLGTFCGNSPRVPVVPASSSHQVLVRFTTDGSETRRGFKATFTAVTPKLTLFQRTILDAHNEHRSGAGSSDMTMMEWDDRLARLAQEIADRCKFTHTNTGRSNKFGYWYIGENIYLASRWFPSAEIPQDVTDLWWGEKEFYNYNTKACRPGEMCGHYTQMAWAQSYALGCAYTRCSTVTDAGIVLPKFSQGHLVFCHYGPGGNIGSARPYKKGAPCTQCPESHKAGCANKLCLR